jgi:hypothetical protein
LVRERQEALRRGWEGLETLWLEPPYWHFCEEREAAPRRVFNIHVKLLEIDGGRNTCPGPRRIGVGSLRIYARHPQQAIATALGIEELRPIGNPILESSIEADADLRLDDRIVDISDHAARNLWLGLALRLGGRAGPGAGLLRSSRVGIE